MKRYKIYNHRMCYPDESQIRNDRQHIQIKRLIRRNKHNYTSNYYNKQITKNENKRTQK